MRDLKKCEHDELSEMMSLALDGLLDPNGHQSIEDHVNTCPECRQRWQIMQQTSVLLADSAMPGPPLGFSTRIERQLEASSTHRRRLFRGLAVLTGSLSLATITITVSLAVGLVVAGWDWLSSQPAVQQESGVISQLSSGLGLLGKAVSLFLGDMLTHYGVPVALVLGLSLLLLASLWGWLLNRQSQKTHRNGYA